MPYKWIDNFGIEISKRITTAKIVQSAICLRRVHFALTFATSSPQSVHRQRKKIGFDECFRQYLKFFFRYTFVMKFSSSQSCVTLFIFPSISASTFTFRFEQNAKRNFSYFNSFKQLIRAEKENGRKKTYQKKNRFFPPVLLLWLQASVFNLQTRRKRKKN